MVFAVDTRKLDKRQRDSYRHSNACFDLTSDSITDHFRPLLSFSVFSLILLLSTL